MDKIRFSKTDSRRTVMALAVVAMFVATLGVGIVDAAASQVSITSDKTSATIMVGEYVIATLTLDSSDSRYRNMDVYMIANWPGGTAWTHAFYDVNGDELPGRDMSQVPHPLVSETLEMIGCREILKLVKKFRLLLLQLRKPSYLYQ